MVPGQAPPTQELTQEQRRALLHAARQALTERLRGATGESDVPADPVLLEPRGAFVTLHKKGNLRGCIGTFESSTPLWDTVRRMAVAAALSDPRFPPVGAEELADLHLEISALTPLRPADPASIQVGQHGIYVTRGMNRGVLLPQVATENGWDQQTFLEHTCLKAGLPPDAWKDPGTVVEVFSAEVFSE